MKYSLKLQSNRPTPITAVRFRVVGTYTLDHQYVQTYELADGDFRKLGLAGSVLALHPTTQKVVPNFTSYGFAAVGILLHDTDCGDPTDPHDQETDVLWRGVALENRCWDDGEYGGVLDATKDTLADRISFVTRNSSGTRRFYGS